MLGFNGGWGNSRRSRRKIRTVSKSIVLLELISVVHCYAKTYYRHESQIIQVIETTSTNDPNQNYHRVIKTDTLSLSNVRTSFFACHKVGCKMELKTIIDESDELRDLSQFHKLNNIRVFIYMKAILQEVSG